MKHPMQFNNLKEALRGQPAQVFLRLEGDQTLSLVMGMKATTIEDISSTP